MKLKRQYFGHLMGRGDLLKRPGCWERLKAKGKEGFRMRWLDSITDSVDINVSKLPESGGQRRQTCCSPWSHKESDRTQQLKNKNSNRQGQHVRGRRKHKHILRGNNIQLSITGGQEQEEIDHFGELLPPFHLLPPCPTSHHSLQVCFFLCIHCFGQSLSMSDLDQLLSPDWSTCPQQASFQSLLLPPQVSPNIQPGLDCISRHLLINHHDLFCVFSFHSLTNFLLYFVPPSLVFQKISPHSLAIFLQPCQYVRKASHLCLFCVSPSCSLIFPVLSVILCLPFKTFLAQDQWNQLCKAFFDTCLSSLICNSFTVETILHSSLCAQHPEPHQGDHENLINIC